MSTVAELLGLELRDLAEHAEMGSKPALEHHTAYLRGMLTMLLWTEHVDRAEFVSCVENAISIAWARYKQVSKPC